MVKMVIAVRKDLEMGKGKIAAQVAHAAVSCALISMKKNKKIFSEWLSEGQKKVVIKVDGLQEIYKLNEICRDAGIITQIITDAGYTQIMPGTVTCIGIGPDEDEILDKITGAYHLL
ncbi:MULTISPECIES: peptidyl-tRNA hydrolase Pth2 [Acidiplasma]|jgi:PTH2 family peptidyl-tRNA hydrolase|uniref:Peptidyl-tRNA hydrolase n=2 Tax=Acidiplasma TaxID=507753 RepID=A0A0Q1B7A7_9ARCH|nr:MULTISPECIES: peptidyl-tRNA hydrolase Pth2 [Acidiplasma]KJE49021.1 peptidyl-tRNA hydrolase [Acidiplasma sp. MBA-1]KPV47019.1 peptidyl-tRNA hydrolase [Acidiplasma aeolicum]KQB34467.1 peptidyl-tRNA hydrolase [Acidiplasma aeolicum]KQB36035.1 peptidyl-tRNA hydrolase [Acidiplasma cupricumulans]WMT54457.1 MAG: peptidyl-tRNA hydrolase Pth2 [Acidiplasma sp.]